MNFNNFQDKYIPEDIELIVPKNSDSNTLVYIPWDDKYLDYVPEHLKSFFIKALPYLGVRTTDVHTAICTSYIDDIIRLYGGKVNRRVIDLGLILHDIGWSSLSEQDIIDSLSDYKGLELSDTSMGPKKRHAVEGVKVSKKLLDEFDFEPALKEEEKKEILEIVLLHDTPENTSVNGQLVADLDRLWSFTHENFWQDTIRKNVLPDNYLDNLNNDCEGYFSTKAGLTIAKELLNDRTKEVNQLKVKIYGK